MTGDLLLDWSKFQRGLVSPAKAFEAFSAQLFERWVRREYGDNLQFYALHGASGDCGVGAFAISSVWQARTHDHQVKSTATLNPCGTSC
jgi:hypothetical protein